MMDRRLKSIPIENKKVKFENSLKGALDYLNYLETDIKATIGDTVDYKKMWYFAKQKLQRAINENSN